MFTKASVQRIAQPNTLVVFVVFVAFVMGDVST